VPGSFTFTTPATAPGLGTASQSVTFTPTDATDYNTSLTTVSVTVNKATPTVSTPPTASAISYGQTLASSVLSGGVASVAGTFAFTTPATAPGTGVASQSVTFTPTDTTHYNTASLTVNVTVNKATTSVTTPPTASVIASSETLADSILSGGAASVPGSFAFTTPATVPGVGTASQSVTFTPTDATDYKTALTTVSVTVVARLSFPTWTAANGISGTAAAAFVARNAGRTLPNGLVYAFQSNLAAGEQCLVVHSLNGVPVVEAPLQDSSTLADVTLVLEATTDVTSGTWPLALTLAADQSGLAANHRRWVPAGSPPQAFFRLRTTLK